MGSVLHHLWDPDKAPDPPNTPHCTPSLSDMVPQDSPSMAMLHQAGAARGWIWCSKFKLISLQEIHHWSHLQYLAGECLGLD